MRWGCLPLLLLAACVDSRPRSGAEQDLAIHEGDDLAVEEGDLRMGPGDLRAAKDAAIGDMVNLLDQFSMTGDLAFPGTDMKLSGLVPGDTCADAPVLPLDTIVEAQTTDDSTVHDDYHFWNKNDLGGSPCDSLTAFQYDGPDTVYKLDVPAGKTLRVQAQSQLGWDLTVALFTDCAEAAHSCVADADDALPIGNPEQVEYTNATGNPQTVFVLIDGWDTPEKGSYTIQAVLQ